MPHKITVGSWSWVGEDEVYSLVTGKEAFWSRKLRGERLRPLLEALEQADVVTGHNVIRYDLPVLNAECARTGLRPLRAIQVSDSIRLPKTKGLKKGMDVLANTFHVALQKKAMHWGEWDDAYEVDGWPEVVERCESDVLMHKELREAMLEQGWSKPMTWWRP